MIHFMLPCKKIPKIVDESKVQDIFGRSQFKRIAMGIETYFNNWDIDVIFRRNMKDSLTCDFNRSLENTKDDQKMSKKIVSLLDTKGAVPIDEIRKIYDAYEQKCTQISIQKSIGGRIFWNFITIL